MQQNPWEADGYPVGLETFYILYNTKVHYCADKSLPLYPVQSQTNYVQTFMCYFFNVITERKLRNPLICLSWDWHIFSFKVQEGLNTCT
jgi:hypothetical protein